ALRLWDGNLATEKDGEANNTAVFLPDGRLLTGSMWKRHGWLQTWACPLGQAPQPDKQRTASFPPQENLRSFPRALELSSSRAGGPLGHAAVVLRKFPGDRQRLSLIDLRDGSFGTVRADVALWTGATLATVAAA